MEDICETGPTESLTICEGGEGGGAILAAPSPRPLTGPCVMDDICETGLRFIVLI